MSQIQVGKSLQMQKVSKSSKGFINIYDMSEPLGEAEDSLECRNPPKKRRFLSLLTGKNNNFRVYRRLDDIGCSISYANYRLYGSIKAAIANTAITPDGLCRCDQMSSIVNNLTAISFSYSTKRIKRLKGSPPMTFRELETKEEGDREKRSERKKKSRNSPPSPPALSFRSSKDIHNKTKISSYESGERL